MCGGSREHGAHRCLPRPRFIKRKKFDDELVESSLAKSSSRAKGGVEPGRCSGSEPSSSEKKKVRDGGGGGKVSEGPHCPFGVTLTTLKSGDPPLPLGEEILSGGSHGPSGKGPPPLLRRTFHCPRGTPPLPNPLVSLHFPLR